MKYSVKFLPNFCFHFSLNYLHLENMLNKTLGAISVAAMADQERKKDGESWENVYLKIILDNSFFIIIFVENKFIYRFYLI